MAEQRALRLNQEHFYKYPHIIHPDDRWDGISSEGEEDFPPEETEDEYDSEDDCYDASRRSEN